ncbi:huntingtin [Zootermopsis nevadensis]|uniref:Huntingtin n=1 Tax=Zootermopsis nevadensis TaxID=136037 RepID=A0A067RBZ0_ZOONE|nr:huntingtin [Zootermopsis nevadensis]KDR16213.1 Huntingtin [Zootermopsis nevadensis]
MASLEKLLKSLESLKLLQLSPALSEETSIRKKEKISHCLAIADAMCHSGVKGAPNVSYLLSIAIEILLQMCDDSHSDVRMIADESLNRVIRAMSDSNVVKIQVELHKEIKKNGNPRPLRAALWRFAELCHLIRPQKGKPYVVNLIPCIIHIARRTEEPVLETLAAAMPKIFKALGNFTSDNDVKGLLKAFLQNLSSSSAVVRRTAAASILTICLNCRKPHVFFSYILNTLLDCVVPIREGQSVSTVLGVLGCLRNIFPHMSVGEGGEEEMRGSFGVRRCHQEAPLAVDRMIQIYELCLHYTNHGDHNVVNAALETLHQLLQSPPPDLLPVLLSSQGVTRSRVQATEGQEKLTHRSLSQMSVAQSFALGDENSLLDPDPELPDLKLPSIEKWVGETKAVLNADKLAAARLVEKPVFGKSGINNSNFYGDETQSTALDATEDDDDDNCDGDGSSIVEDNQTEYSSIQIGTIQDQEDIDSQSPTRSTTPKHHPMAIRTPQLSSQSDDIKDEEGGLMLSPSPVASQGSSVPFQECVVGSFTDAAVPLVYCSRHLAASFLLTGCAGFIMPDSSVRVSVKALALSCIASIVRLSPSIIFLSIDKNKEPSGTQDVCDSNSVQILSDVLLFASHPDPQLRGITSTVIGCLLHSALVRSGGNFHKWVDTECKWSFRTNEISVPELMKLLLKGLEDESSVCCRQTLLALNLCLPELLESIESQSAAAILKALPLLVNNSYWLIKVKLVEVVSQLSYVTIYHLTGNSDFQEKVISSIVFVFLKDEDVRVRHAAAKAILRVIPKLFFPLDQPQQDAATVKGAGYSEQFLSEMLAPSSDSSGSSAILQRTNINNLPAPFNVCFPYAVFGNPRLCYRRSIDTSLSRIVCLLSQSLLMSASKYLTFGCCEALALLSSHYLTTVYPKAWNCSLSSKTGGQKPNSRRNTSQQGHEVSSADAVVSPAAGLFSTTLAVLTGSPISLDLSCQQWLIELAGNIFSGVAVCSLRPSDSCIPGEAAERHKQLWGVLRDKQLSSCAEMLLLHVVRILNIFVHVLEELAPTVPAPKPSLPSFSTAPSLSPIKRKGKVAEVTVGTATAAGTTSEGGRTRGLSPVKTSLDKEERSSEDKKSGRGTSLGFFAGISHYMKIHDIMKSAYTNYKITLDSGASEKFVSLLRVTLETLSQLLEVGTLNEAGRIAEEILSYLRFTVSVEPTATVKCVQQLLKCLFGTNLSAQWVKPDDNQRTSSSSSSCTSDQNSEGFYGVCFQTPYRHLTDFVTSPSNKAQDKDEGFMWMNCLRRKSERKGAAYKGFIHGADKTSLASYIRLFEPMVIKALKQYTVTSDVQLQCRVLLLLSQLVQLRVNYCLLDSDQIFIGFVLKQFEFIEEGQIPNAEELIPRIFYFLVHLSYDEHHSKSIIGVPKVIQLCDGLMASGQSPVTHCIPALVPVVEDVFLIRGSSSTSSFDMKELDTQREVLVSMLLRLVEYHQVLELLSMVLNESRESEERWRRWSRQVVDALLPLLAQGRVRLESREAQHSLQRLLASVAPCVLRPVDSLLRTLFSEAPQMHSTTVVMERWLGMVLAILLLLISLGKEEVVLARLEELELCLPPLGSLYRPAERHDPLNVAATIPKCKQLPPEQVMARFLMQVLGLVSNHIHGSVYSPLTSDETLYLQEQFSHFLLYCIYMFESGRYCRVATAVMQMVQQGKEMGSDPNSCLPINDINNLFLELAPKCPMHMFKWCYILTLVNFSDQTFWAQILRTQPHDLILEQGPVQAESCGPSPCINLELVRKGGTILYCDYVCENMNDAEQLTWLLVNHIEEVVSLSTEPPVQELIAAVHRNPVASGLLVQAVGARCQKLRQPSFVCRVLHCLEGVHPSQSGTLLILLIPRLLGHPQLAPARLAGTLACRRAELLLTLSADEVAAQLSEADLKKIMDILHSTSLARKHSGLLSLLNKLGAQYYNIPPLELDPGQTFDPSDIRSVTINRAWFLAQVTARCCHCNQSGAETAQLLSKLEYEEIVSILSCKEFNSLNLKDCLKLGTQLTLQAYQNLPASQVGFNDVANYVAADQSVSVLESPLYRAARLSVLQHVANIRALIPKPHQVYYPQGRDINMKEAKYSSRLDQLLGDPIFWRALFRVSPAVTCYLQSLPVLTLGGVRPGVPQASWDDVGKFGILCLEAVYWLLRADVSGAAKPKPWYLHIGLSCADEVLREPNLGGVIGQANHASWMASAAGALSAVVKVLLEGEQLPSLTASGLNAALNDPETVCAAHACHQMAVLVLWLEKTRLKISNIPKFLVKPVKSLVVGLSRLPLVNSYVVTPPDVWRQGWAAELSGPCHTFVPPLPVDYLQDTDVLQQLIFRITLLGWTSRQQFEETWMAFLSVLSSNPVENCAPEEVAIMVHASSLAVQAITALLVQTLMLPIPGNPNASQLVHQPREKALPQSKCNEKLRAIHELLVWRLQDQEVTGQCLELKHVLNRSNIERILSPDRYGYSQVSLEYLWTATRMLDTNSNPGEGDTHKVTVSASCLEHEQYLAASGLDLHSCLHFLLDLYSQWTLPQSGTPLQLVSEAVRSILAVSDLFTEKAQFQWMLATCLELGKHHPFEDEILHQYLVFGACKAAAVLGPDTEVYERVRKLVENSLRSGFLPARIAGLHGVLFLLQATPTRTPAQHFQASSGSVTEEIYHMQPLAIDYIQKHIDIGSGPNSHSEEHQLVMWGLMFFLLENMEEQMMDTEVAPAVLQLALTLVTAHSLSPSVHLALIQGLERLVVTGSVGGKVAEQVTKLSVERMRHPNPTIAVPALQLLLSCMYTERCEDLKQNGEKLTGKAHDPELLIPAMEKTSAIFDRIKKGYPFEVELLCGVLSNLLTDFFPPSEIMTKVIGEFLSTQQPHPRLLAAVVFQVFECACEQSQLPLLQDWVVLSVANFTQCYPVGMASWCLTCFFISASINPWLRALFPHVQSRIGRCEYEDRKLLCLAAADFYRQLKDEKQKLTFQSAFQTAANQPLFADILACL